MPTIWGVLALIVGAPTLLASMLVSIRAYGGDRVPFWSRPKREPWWAAVLRGVGMGLSVWGAITLTGGIGYWSVAVLVLLFVVVFSLVPLHNRRVVEDLG